MSVEEHLSFGYHREGCDPRNESGLAASVRCHPPKSIEVRSCEVHEDRLREVIEVEPQHQDLGVHRLRGVVQKAASPRPRRRNTGWYREAWRPRHPS